MRPPWSILDRRGRVAATSTPGYTPAVCNILRHPNRGPPAPAMACNGPRPMGFTAHWASPIHRPHKNRMLSARDPYPGQSARTAVRPALCSLTLAGNPTNSGFRDRSRHSTLDAATIFSRTPHAGIQSAVSKPFTLNICRFEAVPPDSHSPIGLASATLLAPSAPLAPSSSTLEPRKWTVRASGTMYCHKVALSWRQR